MGMAASQARLLTLTARIHDVEYQAQSIQNAKVQLSTKQDRIYQDYQDALDATSLTFTAIDPNSAEKSTIIATFNNLFSVNRANVAGNGNYGLFDSKGRIVVDEGLANGYESYKSEGIVPEDEYSFAMYMLGVDVAGEEGTDLLAAERAFINNKFDSGGNFITDDEKLETLYKDIMDVLKKGTTTPQDIYDKRGIDGDKKLEAQYEKALKSLKNYIYTDMKHDYADEIYQGVTNSDGFDRDKFNYYKTMYKVIEQSTGCISINEFNGVAGDAKNDSEWLTSMVQSGQMTIAKITEDNRTGELTLNGTSPSSDEGLKYTTTTEIDKVALAKAEAKYEHDMKEIDKKDKAFDLDLSKLETERSALTTEYESVKKVISDNVERTFGIFS